MLVFNVPPILGVPVVQSHVTHVSTEVLVHMLTSFVEVICSAQLKLLVDGIVRLMYNLNVMQLLVQSLQAKLTA